MIKDSRGGIVSSLETSICQKHYDWNSVSGYDNSPSLSRKKFSSKRDTSRWVTTTLCLLSSYVRCCKAQGVCRAIDVSRVNDVWGQGGRLKRMCRRDHGLVLLFRLCGRDKGGLAKMQCLLWRRKTGGIRRSLDGGGGLFLVQRGSIRQSR